MVFGTNNDLGHIENLMRVLKRAQHTLDGEEVVAAAESIRWLVGLHKKVKESLTIKPATPSPDRLEDPASGEPNDATPS